MFKTQTTHSTIRFGLTLVEIMIALVMTLIILGAMMSAFSYGSAEMQKGRAAIELNNRLITAEEQLRRDLDRITVELKPHHNLTWFLPKGYVEIVDGVQTDFVPGNATGFAHGGNELVYGDRDDFFACTIKSEGKAFRGRRTYGGNNDIVESHLAEVAWFSVFDASTADPTDVIVVRRQLLILPSLGVVGTAAGYNDFIQNNDISVRIDGPNLVANSLDDLAIRGNRFSHDSPTALTPATSVLATLPLDLRHNDNHIMFSSVAAFDIKVFDPNAYVRVATDITSSQINAIAEPYDIGGSEYQAPIAKVGVPVQLGGYVDLGKGVISGTDVGTFGAPVTPTFPPYTESVFDTGTSFYDWNAPNDPGSNGVDDDGDGLIDEPSNDANQNGVIDPVALEVGETQATIPYDAPIRGLKFTMRVIEPVTKQVRQLSVTKSFVPE